MATKEQVEAARKTMQQLMLRQSFSTIGRVGVGALSVGLASRGLVGFLNTLRRNSEAADAERRRQQGESFSPFPHLAKAAENEGFWSTGLGRALTSGTGESTASVPWLWPATAAVGAGGLYGGWRLADWLLDKRRHAELDTDIDQAKSDFEEALLEEQAAAKAGSLAYDLERLYNAALIKQAGVEGASLGALGLYLTLLGAAGGGSGLMAYKHVRSRQKQQLLDKAQALRRKDEQTRGLSPIVLSPVAVPGPAEPASAL